MSHAYRAVAWTPSKKKYDVVLGASVLAYASVFAGATLARHPNITAETLVMRMSGSLAFAMMSAALLAGPLSRLWPRFLPVLRNRRHLGVATFLAAAVHGGGALLQFHFLGALNPAASLLLDGGATGRGSTAPPFQLLGAVALAALFLMAATSHDFWLRNLTPGIWKALHMLAYPAYAILLGHVAMGALQQEARGYVWAMTCATAAAVFAAHAASAWKGRRQRTARSRHDDQGYERAVRAADLEEGRGRVVDLEITPKQRGVKRRRVALFRHGSSIFCLSNACSHQMGPLGEGKIVDGYVTCPWHGFQFDPRTGRAPAPFEDCVATYDTKVRGGWVWVRPVANAHGAPARAGSVAPASRGGAALPRRPAAGSVAAASLVVAVAVALAAGLGHGELPSAHFEFGTIRSSTGFVVADPYPSLLIPRGPVWTRFLLVGEGKHGADDLMASSVGTWATLEGSLVHRDGHAMVEVRAVTAATPRPPPRAVAEEIGLHVVEGEIVGAKCYMGVMRPGDGTVHRACATLCIRGGVPPLLRVERADGTTEALVLVDADGRQLNARVLDHVGVPVRVAGRLARRGATLFLHADPADIERID